MSRVGIGGVMPLDRYNAQARRDAAAMQASTMKQRLESEEQRVRIRRLKDMNDAMRERIRLRRIAFPTAR
jgi:hypothetical protein